MWSKFLARYGLAGPLAEPLAGPLAAVLPSGCHTREGIP